MVVPKFLLRFYAGLPALKTGGCATILRLSMEIRLGGRRGR